MSCRDIFSTTPLKLYEDKIFYHLQPGNEPEVRKILARLEFYGWQLSALNEGLLESKGYDQTELKYVISTGEALYQYGLSLYEKNFPQGPTLNFVEMFGDFQKEFYNIKSYSDRWFKRRKTLSNIVALARDGMYYRVMMRLSRPEVVSRTLRELFERYYEYGNHSYQENGDRVFAVSPSEPLKIQLVEEHAGVEPLVRGRHQSTATIGYHLQQGIDFDYNRNSPSDRFTRHDQGHVSSQIATDQEEYAKLGIHTSEQVDKFQHISNDLIGRLLDEIQSDPNGRRSEVRLFVLAIYVFEAASAYPVGLADNSRQSALIREYAPRRRDPKHYGLLAATFSDREIEEARQYLSVQLTGDNREFNRRWATP